MTNQLVKVTEELTNETKMKVMFYMRKAIYHREQMRKSIKQENWHAAISYKWFAQAEVRTARAIAKR